MTRLFQKLTQLLQKLKRFFWLLLCWPFVRFGDFASGRLIEELRRRVRELETDLAVREATIRVREEEVRLQSDVITRDRARVQAEMAAANVQKAVVDRR